jgi:N-acyl amino acid synthase of PEP-CTERM/exosortase system
MFLPETFNLGEAFKHYFEIVPACSDAQKDEVYRIRHQVFCEELAYEAPRPDRRESDEYDAHSLHVLIRSMKTGEFIGCTRIIRARPQDPYYPLPFEKICTASLDRSIVDPVKLPRDTIAEVSRLAVIAEFRKRKGEGKKPLSISDQDFGTPTQPRFPYIPVSLYLATVELARLNGIDTLFVLTDQRLASHFRKLGVDIQTIGTPVEHRGNRIPSMIKAGEIINNLGIIFRPLYRKIASEVALGVKHST